MLLITENVGKLLWKDRWTMICGQTGREYSNTRKKEAPTCHVNDKHAILIKLALYVHDGEEGEGGGHCGMVQQRNGQQQHQEVAAQHQHHCQQHLSEGESTVRCMFTLPGISQTEPASVTRYKKETTGGSHT